MMKHTKKLIISIITVALSLILVVGSIFTVSAMTYEEYKSKATFQPAALSAYKSQGHGSFDTGVVAPFNFYKWYHPSVQYMDPTIDGHPNLDFSKGYEFWHDNSSHVKMTTEGNNTFATIIGDSEYKGISTVKFTHSKIKEGDTLAVLYKWRAPSHQRAVEAFMTQLARVTDETNDNHKDDSTIDLSKYDGRNQINIWLADEEDDKEWNIALSRVYLPVSAPIGEYPFTYFNVGFQSTANAEFFKNTDIDDIQIVKFNEDTGLVTDLDDKQLYNTNKLAQREVVDYFFGDLGETDPNADKKVNVKDLISGKVDLNESVNDTKEEIKNEQTDDSSEGVATWIWIVIAAGVVLLLAVAAVVVIIIIKKKKANVTTEE